MNSGKISVEWDREKRKFRLTESAVLGVENLYFDSKEGKELRPLNNVAFDMQGDKAFFTIPKGFLTDFGSIPRPFKPFFNPIGKEVPAYVLHDYLCSLSNKGKISRLTADNVFKVALKQCGTSTYRTFMVYFGVRCISLYRKFFPFKPKK